MLFRSARAASRRAPTPTPVAGADAAFFPSAGLGGGDAPGAPLLPLRVSRSLDEVLRQRLSVRPKAEGCEAFWAMSASTRLSPRKELRLRWQASTWGWSVMAGGSGRGASVPGDWRSEKPTAWTHAARPFCYLRLSTGLQWKGEKGQTDCDESGLVTVPVMGLSSASPQLSVFFFETFRVSHSIL